MLSCELRTPEQYKELADYIKSCSALDNVLLAVVYTTIQDMQEIEKAFSMVHGESRNCIALRGCIEVFQALDDLISQIRKQQADYPK